MIVRIQSVATPRAPAPEAKRLLGLAEIPAGNHGAEGSLFRLDWSNRMPQRDELFSAAERLHACLLRRHFHNGVLHGPDVGVRFNLRAWRFLKSGLDFIPWRDDYTFMQSQGYWVLANWMFFEATGEGRFWELALETSEATRRLQQPEGYWSYPLPERKHLIATVEGNWGAVALLASHAREPRKEFLESAVRWHDFVVTRIGFQDHSLGKAVNYFDRPRGKVPNNSAEAIWVFLLFWKATGDRRFLEHVSGLLNFLAAVQLRSGELPYIVESAFESRREHYQCFQYNAFQFLKLRWSAALGGAPKADSLLAGLAHFLERGVVPSGACALDCRRQLPEIDYHTAVLAAALEEAWRLGLAESSGPADRAYARVLSRQRPDGSFGFSSGDYGFLRDQRSYPRQQVMTLFHLLYGCGLGNGFPPAR